MIIREIIEKSKFKEDIDREILQNCIIALSGLIYFLKSEINLEFTYKNISKEMRELLLKNMNKMIDGCYNNNPENYIGRQKNSEHWKKIYGIIER